MNLRVPFLYVATLLCPTLVVGTSTPVRAQGTQDPRRSPVVEVVSRVSDTVVSISTKKLIQRRYSRWDGLFEFEGRNSRQGSLRNSALGSGLLIDAKGYLVTNDHVISRADRILVTTADGREFPARLVGSDSNNDIAVLKIESEKPFPQGTLGDSDDLLLGETTVAMGNPFGLGGSVTSGILSATKRSVNFRGKEVYTDFLQTSAVINPGNSGGPLLNIKGQVIGINVAIHSGGPGIGFAIPVNRVREVVHKILDPQLTKKAWLGLDVEHESENVKATISSVDSEGPAAQHDLRPGDRILEINGTRIEQWIDFQTTLDLLKAGADVRLEIQRSGERSQKTLKLEVLPESPAERAIFGMVGFRFSDIPRQLKVREGTGISGILVTKVIADSSATEIGVQKGDIVTHFGRYPIRNKEEASRIVQSYSRRSQTLPVSIIRNGVRYQGTIAL